MTERKSFQDLPSDENPQFSDDGVQIYRMLRTKYPNKTNEHFDNIFNGICAALFIMMKNSVAEDNYRYFIQLVHNVLTKNLND